VELLIEQLAGPTAGDAEAEIVERKGLGHPDSICDALAERLSTALSRAYLERFGIILHHNLDKVLLSSGVSRPAFGGGKVLVPCDVYFAGRAVNEIEGARVPVEEIAIEEARAWFRENMHALDVGAHVRLHCLVRPGSSELTDLFNRKGSGGPWLANDTSCGVGHAPLSRLERLVLALEKELNAPSARERRPSWGEDMKVMGLRAGGSVSITLARAFVDRHVRNLADYLDQKADLLTDVRRLAEQHGHAVDVVVNAADAAERGAIYLTVTGTSAECGDDGEVGRGNRASGLITPYRPMSLEALAGKNPVNHVGKLYNVMAREISEALVAELDGVEHAECYLLSQIGRSIADPELAHVRLAAAELGIVDAHRGRAAEIVGDHLSRVASLTERFVRGEIGVF
jgi:S-adenosylmethionine synthetase